MFFLFLPSYLTSQHVGGYVFPFLIATNIWFPLFENSSTMSSILSSLETCPPSFAIVAKCQRKISRLELRVELIAAVVLVLIVALLFSLLPLLFSSSFLLPFSKSEKVTAEFLFVLNLKSNGGNSNLKSEGERPLHKLQRGMMNVASVYIIILSCEYKCECLCSCFFTYYWMLC